MTNYAIRTGLTFRDPLSGTEYAVLRCLEDQGTAWLVPEGRLPARVDCPGMHYEFSDSGRAAIKQAEEHIVLDLSEAMERDLLEDIDEQAIIVDLRELVALLFRDRSAKLKHGAGGGKR